MNNFLSSWKSTVTGLLSFLVATGTVILAYTAAVPGNATMAKITTGITIGLALCRAWMGLIQQDADSVKAVTPAGDVKSVPAHPVPDNPADTAVVPPPKEG